MVIDIVCPPRAVDAQLVCGSLFQLLGEEPVQVPHLALIYIRGLYSVVSWAAMFFQKKESHTFLHEMDN